MPIELLVQKTLTVEEGKHEFEIVEIAERKEPYHYIDVHYKLTDAGVTIRDGYSASITENTKLGKLLKEFGVKMEIDTMVNLESVLIGKKGTLMTLNEKTEKGTFARVVEGSVRPSSV